MTLPMIHFVRNAPRQHRDLLHSLLSGKEPDKAEKIRNLILPSGSVDYARNRARALVDEAEAWARAQGCRRIIVTTALHRTGAHAFYERIGYAHTGRRYGKDFA